MDRGYLDFALLGRFTQAGAFSVISGKTNLKFCVVGSRPFDPFNCLRCDHMIALRGFYSKRGYPLSLLRNHYCDVEHYRSLHFLANNFCLSATCKCARFGAHTSRSNCFSNGTKCISGFASLGALPRTRCVSQFGLRPALADP